MNQDNCKIVIVLPAYNAARTLMRGWPVGRESIRIV